MVVTYLMSVCLTRAGDADDGSQQLGSLAGVVLDQFHADVNHDGSVDADAQVRPRAYVQQRAHHLHHIGSVRRRNHRLLVRHASTTSSGG